MKLQLHIKKLFKSEHLITPLLAAVMGSLFTLLFYPMMQSVEYKYWQKKHEEELNLATFDKRVEVVKEFHETRIYITKCFSLASKMEQKNNKKEETMCPSNECDQELIRLWNVSFEANLYFPQEVREELQNLNTLTAMYLFKSSLSPYRTEEYISNVSKSLDKLEMLMQDNISNFDV